MTAGGVPGDENPVARPGRPGRRQRAEMRDGPGGVLASARPAAARRPDPAIFDIPHGKALADALRRQRLEFVAAIGHAPESAVQQADRGARGGVGPVQVGDLVCVRAIGQGTQDGWGHERFRKA